MNDLLLKQILSKHESVAVAFSGGVDSTLLLDVAHEVLGEDALALTVNIAALPERELLAARGFCAERGIRHIILDLDVFSVEGFAENPSNRCYLCKRVVLNALLSAAATEGISALVEGSNLDDEKDYRPGTAAIRELGVGSPLKEAGFTKDEVRQLSRKRGLPTWAKPACACLATRLPVGAHLSPELFRRIDRAEYYLIDKGVRQVRVRVHGDLARIEVDEVSMPLFGDAWFREQTTAELGRLGFRYVTLDLAGYSMGSMN